MDTAKYRVTLRIDIDGAVYEYGQVADLTLEQARRYAHALIAIEERHKEEVDGRNAEVS